MVNENYFDVIDSESKAYLLGFITADGSINDKTKTPILQVNISTKDVYIIKLLENEIGNTIKTYYSLDGTGVSFRTGSLHLCEVLIQYGIIPRKTGFEYLVFGSMQDDMVRHYIRGLIDGDGWICNTLLNSGHVRKNIGFCGSEVSCTQLRDYLTDLLGVYRVAVSKVKGKNNYKINYAGKNDINKLIHYLYSGSTVYLKRKYIEALA